MSVAECLFCRIAAHEVSGTIVFEDEDLLAFEDLIPQAPIHILVIPKKHVPTTLALGTEDDAWMGRLLRVAAQLARDRGVADAGYRIVLNTNTIAGQSVYHLHAHLLAGRQFGWPPG
jgi:histidine triad (HIT) family protein